jgi:hypothetical protein
MTDEKAMSRTANIRAGDRADPERGLLRYDMTTLLSGSWCLTGSTFAGLALLSQIGESTPVTDRVNKLLER